MKNLEKILLGVAAAVLLAGCDRNEERRSRSVGQRPAVAMDATPVILIPQAGDDRIDVEIRRRQEEIRAGRQPELSLERLGWLFVAKARTSFDPGYYKLAEQCAFELESQKCANESARSNLLQNAMLLRGHVLHNLHRFKEAEPIARELAAQRGSPLDFGLLGDVLMEQGRLEPAIEAYQKMMDLSPDSRAYARVAHIRWLRGDLAGAVSAMQVAVEAVGSRDLESAAWMQTRLAFYQLQTGDFHSAKRACDAALVLQKDYAPAELMRGRILMAEGQFAEAATELQQAAKLNPLPEYNWAATEALAAAGRDEEARQAESLLNQRGVLDDPRTYALYLATHQSRPDVALKLAQKEIKERADVFTCDSLAWAQLAAGDVAAARKTMAEALAEGTQDARLYLHAAVIAERAGDLGDTKVFLEKTCARRHLLWPSERKHLEKTMTALAWQPTAGQAPVAVNQVSSPHP